MFGINGQNGLGIACVVLSDVPVHRFARCQGALRVCEELFLMALVEGPQEVSADGQPFRGGTT